MLSTNDLLESLWDANPYFEMTRVVSHPWNFGVTDQLSEFEEEESSSSSSSPAEFCPPSKVCLIVSGVQEQTPDPLCQDGCAVFNDTFELPLVPEAPRLGFACADLLADDLLAFDAAQGGFFNADYFCVYELDFEACGITYTWHFFLFVGLGRCIGVLALFPEGHIGGFGHDMCYGWGKKLEECEHPFNFEHTYTDPEDLCAICGDELCVFFETAGLNVRVVPIDAPCVEEESSSSSSLSSTSESSIAESDGGAPGEESSGSSPSSRSETSSASSSKSSTSSGSSTSSQSLSSSSSSLSSSSSSSISSVSTSSSSQSASSPSSTSSLSTSSTSASSTSASSTSVSSSSLSTSSSSVSDPDCGCCDPDLPISDTLFLRFQNIFEQLEIPACEQPCQNINGVCFALTRVGGCRWEGVATQDATCFPLSQLVFTLSCDDDITATLEWTLATGKVARWTNTYAGDVLPCNLCFQRQLFPELGVTTCELDFSWVEWSFGHLDECCTQCHETLQVEVLGATEASGEGLCDDGTCQSVLGTYLVTQADQASLPACTSCIDPAFASVQKWCEYVYLFDPSLQCVGHPGREITQLRILLGIHNCQLWVIGEIHQFETSVACFTHAAPLFSQCDEANLDVTLEWCTDDGPPLCDWTGVTLRVKNPNLDLLSGITKLGPLALPMGRITT